MGWNTFVWLFKPPNPKPQLEMAINRLEYISNTKRLEIQQHAQAIQELLASTETTQSTNNDNQQLLSKQKQQQQMAYLRAEALLEDETLVQVYDILLKDCQFLLDHIVILRRHHGYYYNRYTTLPNDLGFAISSIMYASQFEHITTDLPELYTLRKQFRFQYGKTFETNVLNNNTQPTLLNQTLVFLLLSSSSSAPQQHQQQQSSSSQKPYHHLQVQSILQKLSMPQHNKLPLSQNSNNNVSLKVEYNLIPEATALGYFQKLVPSAFLVNTPQSLSKTQSHNKNTAITNTSISSNNLEANNNKQKQNTELTKTSVPYYHSKPTASGSSNSSKSENNNNNNNNNHHPKQDGKKPAHSSSSSHGTNTSIETTTLTPEQHHDPDAPLLQTNIGYNSHESTSLSPILPIYMIHPNPNLEIAYDVRMKNPVYVLEKLDASILLPQDDDNEDNDDALPPPIPPPTTKMQQGPTLLPPAIPPPTNKATSSTTTMEQQQQHKRPQFYEEVTLPPEYRSRLETFRYSGYDRGHMAPAADFGTNKEYWNDTFTLSNVCPQVHSVNISLWKQLEHWCRTVAKKELSSSQTNQNDDGVVYIVTGPLWLPRIQKKQQQENAKQVQLTMQALVGKTKSVVLIPTHFYKVIVSVCSNNNNKSICKFACFVVPNEETDKIKQKQQSIQDFVVRWTDLETASGLQFFSSMTSQPGWKEHSDALSNEVMANCSCSSSNNNNNTSKRDKSQLALSTGSLFALPHDYYNHHDKLGNNNNSNINSSIGGLQHFLLDQQAA